MIGVSVYSLGNLFNGRFIVWTTLSTVFVCVYVCEKKIFCAPLKCLGHELDTKRIDPGIVCESDRFSKHPTPFKFLIYT